MTVPNDRPTEFPSGAAAAGIPSGSPDGADGADGAADGAALDAAHGGGHRAAFGAALESERPRWVGLLVRLCAGDRELAEELWQRAVARAVAYGSWDGTRPLGPWLRAVCFRVWIDERDARRRRPDGDARTLMPGGGLPDGMRSGLEDVELRDEVARLLLNLPREQREVLVRLHRDGESVAAVAAALGMNENTVKSHARRAREALRARFAARRSEEDR